MRREDLIRQVTDALGNRRLVWSGLRGDDVEPIADLPQLGAAFSIVGQYGNRPSVESLAFEDLSGVRPDTETWDIDENLATDETTEFRRAHLGALAQESALLTYRPSRFLSAIWFARRRNCLNLGLFGGHQAAFEHKPWVETSLAGVGIAGIPWTYIADEEQLDADVLLAHGPVVLRRSRTSGGEGIVRVDDHQELTRQWPRGAEAFVSVAPYLDGLVPLNVGATVWRDGVTVHQPSVQLIGIDDCVSRPFGYCGNDFALARELEPSVLEQLETTTVRIGRWLASYGYRGTFGVDFLLGGDRLLFTEVNPRFQGSTHASSRLSVEAGEACLILEHLAALLDLPAPPQRSLVERASQTEPLSHLVVHWTGERPAALDAMQLATGVHGGSHRAHVDVRTRADLATEPGAVVARLTVRQSMTTTGFDLRDPWRTLVSDWRHAVDNPYPDDRRERA